MTEKKIKRDKGKRGGKNLPIFLTKRLKDFIHRQISKKPIIKKTSAHRGNTLLPAVYILLCIEKKSGQ